MKGSELIKIALTEEDVKGLILDMHLSVIQTITLILAWREC